MSDSNTHTKGEHDFKSEAKYKQFSSAIEKALKTFEGLTEWHDLISSLTRINKVLLAYMQYPVVPLQLTVCKRLTQCLHPNLPSGVHLKTLDVYVAIFDRIGPKGLISNLLLYSSGLFPLLSYASMSVRPHLLDIYEKYFLPLGDGLVPTLHGFVLGLLPGLEDEAEHTERICGLLDALSEATDKSTFFYALWQCILGSQDYRLPAANFLLSKLNKKLSAEDQVYCIGGNLPLVVSGVCSALVDKNVLVQRTILDIVSILFPFHQSFLLSPDLVSILTAALETLLKRDISLSRRLYAWLLGSQVHRSSLVNRIQSPSDEFASTGTESDSSSSAPNSLKCNLSYFEKFSKTYLNQAVKSVLMHARKAARLNLSKAECVLPYRLLKALTERPEISESIMSDIMFNLVTCFRDQIDGLGGISFSQSRDGVLASKSRSNLLVDSNPKKSGKKGSLKADIIQSANLLFSCLSQDFLWGWMEALLLKYSANIRSANETLNDAGKSLDGDGESVGFEEPYLNEARALSPVSDLLERDLLSGESSLGGSVILEQVHSSDVKPLGLTALLSLIMFFIQVIPKDSLENVHLQHVSSFLLQLLSLMKSHEHFFSLNKLNSCHGICLYLLNDLLKIQPSSLATTPSTPPISSIPATPFIGGGPFSLNLSVNDSKSQGPVQEIFLSDEAKLKMICDEYLSYFSIFLKDRVIPDSAHHGATIRELHMAFFSSCQVLVVMAKLISKSEIMIDPLAEKEAEQEAHSTLPLWLDTLMTVCRGQGNHSLTLLALETLLDLVEMAVVPEPAEVLKNVVGESVTSPNFRMITVGMVDGIILTQPFVESVTELLWGLLSFTHSSIHVQVSLLLAWLHSLVTCHNACEKVILEKFASQGLGAYQVFTVYWKYMPSVCHKTKIKSFYRAVLRMLEGLQSSDAAVRSLTQSWVKAAVARGNGEDIHKLLEPLVKILLESDTKRKQKPENFSSKKIGLSRKDAEKDMKYAKYYFESLGIDNPYAPSKEDQYKNVSLHYTQALDASQILYALTLFQLTISVNPSNLISAIGNKVIDVSTYACNMHGLYVQHAHNLSLKQLGVDCLPETPSTPLTPSLTSQKSVLEVVLSVCVDLLRSEYHSSLKASPEDIIENLRVKISSASLLSMLLNEMLKILARHSSSSDDYPLEGNFKVCSPNFVSALVTLCDIQKVALLLLGKSVEWWIALSSAAPVGNRNGVWTELARQWESAGGGGAGSPGIILRSLYVQLLRVIQCLIALDTQFSQSLPIEANPPSQSSDLVTVISGIRISTLAGLPPVLPSCATASQPFFKTFMLQVLSDPSLSYFHDDTLCMFVSTISNLLSQQLTELAPKVVKQLCSNIERVMDDKASSRKNRESVKDMESNDIQLCIVYFDSILNITLWCLFGDPCFNSMAGDSLVRIPNFTLHHRSPNPFFDILGTKQVTENAKENFSPSQKQPSTMAWLLGVFTAQKNVSSMDSEGGFSGVVSRIGINTQAGQHIMMLLSAVYNAMTDMWIGFRLGSFNNLEGAGFREGDFSSAVEAVESCLIRKQSMAFEDIEWLFGQFLCTLAEREPIAFFSSVSQIWLEWNLDDRMKKSTRVSQRKEAFIDVLHHVKVLPLAVLINCFRSTLSNIAHVEEYRSGILRQKYLLHFLYKYISSTRQSSRELSDCRTYMLSFLREYYGQIYNPTPQALLSISHILCMLTSILHVLVCRVTPPDPKTQKKERKELQEVTHKFCETLSMVANVGITHPDYVMVEKDNEQQDNSNQDTKEEDVSVIRSSNENLTEGIQEKTSSYTQVHEETKPVILKERSNLDEDERSLGRSDVVRFVESKRKEQSASVELLQPIIQALAVLSNVLAHFIDCVFGSPEKDKILSLLKAVLFNVWPHLHNHNPDLQQCYVHSSKLLASLSGFQVTRKSWRKEVFDLFLAHDFFVTSIASLSQWKVIIDNLMTQDQVTFRDLLARLHSTSAPGVVNLFSSLEQEVLSGTILLKRMAFAILSGEVDQYVKYLPDIQEKLSEYLKILRYPSICCEVLLTFRVLLLKLAPHHLMAFWPAVTTELLSLFSQLESDMESGVLESSQSSISMPKSKLLLYLSACKLLDTALALPTQYLPHFQWLRWGFISHGTHSGSEELVVTRLCRQFKLLDTQKGELKHVYSGPPYLRSPSVSSLQELKPLFDALMYYRTTFDQGNVLSDGQLLSHLSLQDNCNKISLVEDIILQDFLEPYQ